MIRVVLVNTSNAVATVDVISGFGAMVQVPAMPGETNSGYAKLDDGLYPVLCNIGVERSVDGRSLTVGS